MVGACHIQCACPLVAASSRMTRPKSPPAVQDGRLCHVSVSQISSFLRCRRLWAADKILGLRAEQTRGQGRGTSNHEEAERYYQFGELPSNEAFCAAIPGLPPRAEGLLIETRLEEPTLYVEDVHFEGWSDLVVPPTEITPPWILDWKFVSSFNYTQDPANDLQMLIYGYWASVKWPQATEIKLTLAYFRSYGSSDFKIVTKIVPRERCEAEWLDIVLPAVQAMRSVAEKGGGFYDYAPNFADNNAACKKYGGCHLIKECGVKLKDGKQHRKEMAILKDWDLA
jgi:hypothetical protein